MSIFRIAESGVGGPLGLLLGLSALGPCARAAGADAAAPARQVPLAYVRTVCVSPVAVATPADPPLPPEPPARQKRARTRWQAQASQRAALAAMRAAAGSEVEAGLRAGLGALQGVTVRPRRPDERGPVWRTAGGTPAPAGLSTDPVGPDADAVVAAAVTHFAVHTGVERAVSVSVVCWLRGGAGASPAGPFRAYGHAIAGRNLFERGFHRTDAELVAAAAAQAARRVVRCLDGGEESPFAGARPVAILPALIPEFAPKRTVASGATQSVALTSVLRQGDVLFQPDLGPAALVASAARVRQALAHVNAAPGTLWESPSRPSVERVCAVGRQLDACVVFVTRVTAAAIEERPDGVASAAASVPRAGVFRRANVVVVGALVRASSGEVVWSAEAVGEATARTEFVGASPRIRSDEQCVADALRTAYSQLAYEFRRYRSRNDL